MEYNPLSVTANAVPALPEGEPRGVYSCKINCNLNVRRNDTERYCRRIEYLRTLHAFAVGHAAKLKFE